VALESRKRSPAGRLGLRVEAESRAGNGMSANHRARGLVGAMGGQPAFLGPESGRKPSRGGLAAQTMFAIRSTRALPFTEWYLSAGILDRCVRTLSWALRESKGGSGHAQVESLARSGWDRRFDAASVGNVFGGLRTI